MPPRRPLYTNPPYAVEAAIHRLGQNLRTARIRRKITLVEMAAKLGVERHVIADAEKGKPTTNIAVYVGMMWVMKLISHLEKVADPLTDEEGQTLAMSEEPERARLRSRMSNDF